MEQNATLTQATCASTDEMNVSIAQDMESVSDLTSLPEYQASVLIWKYIPPVLLMLGGFGNVATIVVLCRISWGQSTQHAFLTALAVVDLGLLYTGLLRLWIWYVFSFDMREINKVICLIHSWSVYSLNNSSAWLLTTVTVQRAMSIVWPHRITAVCTTRKSRIAVAAVVLFSFALHSENLFVRDLKDDKCSRTENFQNIDVAWQWLDLVIASLIPSLILLVCNVILVMALFRSARKASNLSSTAHTAHSNKRKKLATSMTFMLLVLSVTFLLLTLPICVYILWDSYLSDSIVVDITLQARRELADAVTMNLWYANSAVNFLLYCMSGTKFRTQFLAWITCGKVKDSSTLTSSLDPLRVKRSGSREETSI